MSIEKIIGNITCQDLVQQSDGSWKAIFTCSEEFKQEYKKIFNLKRWSKKHFEKKLDEAIKCMSLKVQEERNV